MKLAIISIWRFSRRFPADDVGTRVVAHHLA